MRSPETRPLHTFRGSANPFPTSSTPEFLDRWRGRGRHQSPCPSPTFATLLAYGLGPKVAGPVAWTSKMALGVL